MAFDPSTVDLSLGAEAFPGEFDPKSAALEHPLGRPGARGERLQFEQAQRDRFDISEALSGDGIAFSPQDIDVESGLGFLARADIALADSFAEKRRKFRRFFPEGDLFKIKLPGKNETRLVFKENINDESEKVKTVEDVGFTPGDLADIAGDLPAAIGSAIATRGTSAVAAVTKGALGAMAGETGKAAVEELRGDQLQSFTESALQVGQVGGEALVGGAIAAPIEKTLRAFGGQGVLRASPEARTLARELGGLEAGGQRVRPLMAHQLDPEHKILNRFARQAFSTSTLGERELRSQAGQLGRVASRLPEDIAADPFAIGDRTRLLTRRILDEGDKMLRANIGKKVTQRQAERQLFAGMDEWVAWSRNHGSDLYTRVDDAANIEAPVFDLTSAQATADDILRGIEGVGSDAQGITVTETLPALRAVISDLKQLAPEQAAYEPIKQLRTRLFDIIDNQPWEWDFGKRQAMDLWDALTRTMQRPQGRAPRFVSALREASSFWRDRAKRLQLPTIRALISRNRENTGQLANRFSEPNGLIPEIRQSLLEAPGGQARWDQFRTAAKMKLLQQDDGATARYRDWLKRDPESLNMIVPKGERNAFLKLAEVNDDFVRNNVRGVINETEQSSQIIGNLIKNRDEAGIRDLIQFYGGPGSEGHKLLRAGVFHQFIKDTLEENKKGVVTVNSEKVRGLWNQWNKTGILDRLMTPEDKAKIFALKEYSRFFSIQADPGVSLEAAQAITDLKHPITFFRGVHKLAVNSALARMLVSPKATRLLVGTERQFGRQWPLVASGQIMAILLDDIVGEDVAEIPAQQDQLTGIGAP